MVDRFTVYPGVTYHTGQPHQNIKGEYVRYSDYKALQKELDERLARLEAWAQRDEVPECSMGVGDGGGNLFIHGPYEAIKRVQGLFERNAALEAENRTLREALALERVRQLATST